ncbi:MAG: hypothetical protein N2595_03325 [bacterium]|nr:hypothetical protein [bacterium]
MKSMLRTAVYVAAALLHAALVVARPLSSKYYVPVPGTYGLTLNWGFVLPILSYCNTAAGLYDEYDTATGTLLRQDVPRGVHSNWSGSVTAPSSGWGITWWFRFLPYQDYATYTATCTHSDFLGDSETDVVFVLP